MRAVRVIILKIESMSLKHKRPISLQITTKCADNSDKIWGLPYIFNLPNIERIYVYTFSAMLYFILTFYYQLTYAHGITRDASLLRFTWNAWRMFAGERDKVFDLFQRYYKLWVLLFDCIFLWILWQKLGHRLSKYSRIGRTPYLKVSLSLVMFFLLINWNKFQIEQ